MIKVLHVHCEFAPQSSGVARHIDGLAQALRRRGDISPIIFAPEIATSEKHAFSVVSGGYADLPAAVRGCDAVHAHGSRTGLSAFALRLARMFKKPSFFTPHCYYQGGGALRRFGKNVWDRWIERSSIEHCDAVIALHPGWIDAMNSLGFPTDRTVVVPNCVDADFLAARMGGVAPRRLSGAPALLSISRLDAVKRIDDIIIALEMPALRQAQLHVVGQGPDEQRLQNMATMRGLSERVHFHGWRDDCETAAMMKGCDAMVLASEREGLPTVVIEALASGVPMAVSDIDGNRAIAETVGWPHVFALGDRQSMAECIQACAARPVDPAIIQSVRNHFSWQSRAGDIADLYHAAFRRRS